MTFSMNPLLAGVASPPIAEARGWVDTLPDEVREDGRDLLDVAQAVPAHPPAEALRRHLAEAVLRPEMSGYTAILGRDDLRQALAAHMSEDYAAEIAPGETAITAGCNQAYCLAISALAAPGDEVIVPLPYYFNHNMWLEMQGVRPVYLPYAPERGGVPDPAAAAALITERTRAILLVSPNNPTGALYAPETIAAFYELARERGIALVIDETYKDFRPDAAPPHDLFQRPGWRETLVQLYSFSKAYALPGYRVGSIVAGRAFLEQVAKAADCLAICTANISQEAALFGLRQLGDWRREQGSRMVGRVAALRQALEDADLGYRLISAGAYFAYLEHPFAGEDATAVAKRLARRHKLLALPGGIFGPQQERYLRLAFANLDESRMPEIAARLKESLVTA